MSKLNLYQELHVLLHSFPRQRYPLQKVDRIGIYILYERGERTSFGLPRIVRIGNYSGTGRLFSQNDIPSYRSVFRRHIGRCLLLREGKANSHPASKAAAKQSLLHLKGKAALEQRITGYLHENFSFAVIPPLPDEDLRSRLYAGLIATLAQSSERCCSKKWLGRWHPNTQIRKSCLWNISNTAAKPLSPQELLSLYEHLSVYNTNQSK